MDNGKGMEKCGHQFWCRSSSDGGPKGLESVVAGLGTRLGCGPARRCCSGTGGGVAMWRLGYSGLRKGERGSGFGDCGLLTGERNKER